MSSLLDQVEIFGGSTTKYVIQHKFDHGQDMIDLRKWILFPTASEHFPSKTKGICIPIQKWKLIVEAIDKMIAESSASTKNP